MKLIACDGTWLSNSDGALTCVGTLVSIDRNEIAPSGITPEDASQLFNNAVVLFAIVFGFLALRKAL